MILVSPKILKFFELLFGFKADAIALCPFIILENKSQEEDKVLINHEKIHIKQQTEMLVIFFYIWYIIAFFRKGYNEISFEKEAYSNEADINYLNKRYPFQFLNYLK